MGASYPSFQKKNLINCQNLSTHSLVNSYYCRPIDWPNRQILYVCVDMALVLHNRKCLGRCDPPTGWRSVLRGSTVCRNNESKPYASIGNRYASTQATEARLVWLEPSLTASLSLSLSQNLLLTFVFDAAAEPWNSDPRPYVRHLKQLLLSKARSLYMVQK